MATVDIGFTPGASWRAVGGGYWQIEWTNNTGSPVLIKSISLPIANGKTGYTDGIGNTIYSNDGLAGPYNADATVVCQVSPNNLISDEIEYEVSVEGETQTKIQKASVSMRLSKDKSMAYKGTSSSDTGYFNYVDSTNNTVTFNFTSNAQLPNSDKVTFKLEVRKLLLTSSNAAATLRRSESYTIKLNYTAANYVVSYNGNKPTASIGTVQNIPSNQTKTHGTNLVLSSTKPTLTDYNFVNWNTSANGSGTSYSPGGTYSANAAVTLYAQWQIKTYTVTFVDGWGSTLKTQTVNYGGNATPPSNPTHSGYQFTGWSGTYTNVTSNRTITAQWKILPIWIYNGSSWQRIKKAYKYQSGSWVEITPRIFNGTSWVNMT